MDTKKLILGTLVGGLTFLIVGTILYAFVFMDFFMNNSGTATGAMKDEPDFVLLVVADLVNGLFLTYVLMRFGNVNSFMEGFKSGAIVGLLVFLGFNLIMLATANVSTTASAIVDSLIGLVMCGVSGGLIALVIKDKPASS